MEVQDGVRAERISAFGLRSSRPRSPDGLQDLGVPGVQQEGKRPGRYADAVWLTGGSELLVHNAHISEGRASRRGCRVCRQGPGAILAKVKGSGASAGVVQGSRDDEEGASPLSPVGDRPGGWSGRELQDEEGEVRKVEKDGVSASEWFKGMLATSDERDLGGDHG